VTIFSTFQGYFKADAFEAIYQLLPEYLKPAAKIAYTTGMRFGEISGIKWEQVDLKRGAVTLNPGETKNKRGRIIYLLSDEIDMLIEQRAKMEKRGVLCPYVFPSANGKEKIGDIRKAWNKACREAGIGFGYAITRAYVNKWSDKLPPGPLFHDFRRTAVRNMSRAGISRPIAMKRSGHKTESVFNRYDIDNEEDQQNAAQMLEDYLKTQTVKVTGKVINFANKKESTNNG
jgi:integrase